MIAFIVMLGVVLTASVIMFGIYMIARTTDVLAGELREAQQKNNELYRDISKLQTINQEQKVEITRLKNRKVHDADTE